MIRTNEANNIVRRWRTALKRMPLVPQSIATIRSIAACLLDNADRARSQVDRTFVRSIDPFRFSAPEEQKRFLRALEMLNSARPDRRFHSVLEVGCAEGMFTELLSPMCDSLLAVDVSDIALVRASQRCATLNNVRFKNWDVRSDGLGQNFDLILAVGVLEYLRRPKDLRRAVEGLVTMLDPGGLLLIGTTVKPAQYERTWLGRKLLIGTNLHDAVAHRSDLELIGRTSDEYLLPFEHALFRKTNG